MQPWLVFLLAFLLFRWATVLIYRVGWKGEILTPHQTWTLSVVGFLISCWKTWLRRRLLTPPPTVNVCNLVVGGNGCSCLKWKNWRFHIFLNYVQDKWNWSRLLVLFVNERAYALPFWVSRHIDGSQVLTKRFYKITEPLRHLHHLNHDHNDQCDD